jgi:site-specific DNA recombinase
MHAAVYVRVSTARQAQAQTIEQQLERLQPYCAAQGWTLAEEHVYRDEGYSGARLARPGLDRLRDAAARAAFGVVVLTAPDRLARKYVHQVLVIEELEQSGCTVHFVDRPMSQDPHDHLLLQIRGAVAEYERSLITERMRRGRLAHLRAGRLLPWPRPPFGYQMDPEHPRDPSGLRLDPYAAAIVQQIFAWYLEEGATLYSVATRLRRAGIPSPTGKERWSIASLLLLLHNTAYRGVAYGNRVTTRPATHRRSAVAPVGPGVSHVLRPPEEWIPVPVPPLVSAEVFEQVQAKMGRNRQRARRNNTRQPYLLRNLLNCGCCGYSTHGRSDRHGYAYYTCYGQASVVQRPTAQRCRAPLIPAPALDAVVWADLCAVLSDRQQIEAALHRAQGGAWLPHVLQARQTTLQHALTQLAQQEERLLAAYLAAVLGLPQYARKRADLSQQRERLEAEQREVAAEAQRRIDLALVAQGIEAFCARVRVGLEQATFEQRRALVELLIDHVIVTGDDVEIRYVVPTTAEDPHVPFCHLRKDYRAPITAEDYMATPHGDMFRQARP